MSESSQFLEPLLRRMFAIIDSGEWPKLRELYTVDCHYERPGYEPVEGLPGLIHFYTQVRRIDRGLHRIDAVVSNGSDAAVSGAFDGVLRDGAAVSVQFGDFYRFRGDLICWRKSYFFAPVV